MISGLISFLFGRSKIPDRIVKTIFPDDFTI